MKKRNQYIQEKGNTFIVYQTQTVLIVFFFVFMTLNALSQPLRLFHIIIMGSKVEQKKIIYIEIQNERKLKMKHFRHHLHHHHKTAIMP